MKRSISIFLLAALLFSFFAFPGAAFASQTVRLQLLVTSDLHGWFLPYNYTLNTPNAKGSLAQVATAVDALRDENTLVIDAGDIGAGNSSEVFAHEKQFPMILAMNEIGYDYAAPGNHDFNYGKEFLLSRIDQGGGKLLCGNVYKEDGTTLGQSYDIVEKSGVKIGLIGMVTPNIKIWDAKNLEGWTVTDPVEETKKCIAELRDKVDVLVAVTHMDVENELGTPNSGVRALAEACPELDMIIAGHGHKKIDDMVINGVPIIENANNAQTLAQVIINMKNTGSGWEIECIDRALLAMADYEPKEELCEKLKPYHDIAVKNADIVIGVLDSDYLAKPDEMKGIRTSWVEDSGMIDLIGNAMLHYCDAKIAAASTGTYDANLYRGDICNCDVARLYTYENALTELKMNGSQLKTWMEWSAEFYNTVKEGDLTVSFNENKRLYQCDFFCGVNYEIDISKEAGARIQNLTWPDGTPVKDDEEFIVATSDYRASSLTACGSIYKEGDALPTVVESNISDEINDIRLMIKHYIAVPKNGHLVSECDYNWKLTGYSFDETYRLKAKAMLESGQLKTVDSANGRTPNIKPITIDDVRAVEQAAK